MRTIRAQLGRFHEYRGGFLLVLAVLALWMVSGFLKAVTMGAIFAAILYPLMLRMASWRVSSTIKASLVTFGFLVLFLIPIGILVAIGSQSAFEAIEKAQTVAEQSGATQWSFKSIVSMLGVEGLMIQLSEWLPFDDAQMRMYFQQALQKVGAGVAALLQRLISDLPSLFVSTIVILFTIFYLLIDGRRALQFVRENSFFSPHATDKVLSILQSLCYSTVVASIVAGAVQTTLMVTACLIVGAQNILFIALLTFIASFLPMIGTAPITLFLAAEAFIQGNTVGGVIFLVFTAVIGVSDNVVRPWVLRGGADLHPLVGFVAAFGGLETIGFWGLFIGPVVVGAFFFILPMIARTYRSRA